MKILASLTCSIPELTDRGEYGLIDLDADEAKSLLELHAAARAHLTDLDKRGLASIHFAPSYGTSLAHFTAFTHDDDLYEALEEGRQLAVLLPEGTEFQAENDERDGVVDRMECFRAEVRDDSFVFEGWSRHGSHSLRTENIPLEMVQKIAQSAGVPVPA